MTSTSSQLQTEKQKKQIAKRQKSAAWAIARKTHEGARGAIVLIAFLVLYVPSCNGLWDESLDAFEKTSSEADQEAIMFEFLVDLFFNFLALGFLAGLVGVAFVSWKSRDYLILPKAELRNKWLELGGFPESPP
jgi:hypothetical protein